MIYSKQREGILRTLRYELNHPTAEELYTHLKEREPSLSLATVYRNLNQLSKIGKVMRIEVPNGSDRFDSIADGHYHLICEKCGKAVDIARDAIYMMIITSAPLLLVSLIIGLIVSIFQTVTSIQEQTLTFVPKILAVFITLMIGGSWMLNNMSGFMVDLWSNFSYYISMG